MPSITIRFRTMNADPTPADLSRLLTEASATLRQELADCYGKGGLYVEPLGYDGEMVDPDTIDAVIDDGRGITHTDRASAAVDDEHEAKARSRAEEE